jgi:hypothetical protein
MRPVHNNPTAMPVRTTTAERSHGRMLELTPSGKLVDSFTPTDWAQSDTGDVGLGSQFVAFVGTRWGSSAASRGRCTCDTRGT